MDELTEAESQADREYRHAHGSSFGTAAAAYAEHRPGYAEAAVRWALSPVSAREPLRVLDLAAGTGKLTATLVRRRWPRSARASRTSRCCGGGTGPAGPARSA